MKIAIFVSYLPPHVGGIEVVAEGQIKALASAGHIVTAVTSSCGGNSGVDHTEGYAVHRIPTWNYFENKMGAVFPIFSPSLIWHSYLAVKNTDVVHTHDSFYFTSLAAAFWARVLNKPLVLTQHVDLVPHPKKVVTLVQKFVYATTGNFIMHSSAKIIVLNSRVREFVIRRGIDESRIVFMPNGVDTAVFSPTSSQRKLELRQKYNLPKGKLLALFVGRFVPKKGFSELIALKQIAKLDIVFAGGYAPADHGRSDHHFLGPVSRNEMPDIYKMCDIFVLPSTGEGFPVTVQEAMASGLPIIISDDPAYGVYGLDRQQVKFVGVDQQSIQNALEKIRDSAHSQLEMSRYSQRTAKEKFDADINAQAISRLYDLLVPLAKQPRSTVSGAKS